MRRLPASNVFRGPRLSRGGHPLDSQTVPCLAKVWCSIAALIILCSSTPTLSNNIIPKGLAFVCHWSGSVLAPGAEALRGPAPPA